jgi:hypothetical protein
MGRAGTHLRTAPPAIAAGQTRLAAIGQPLAPQTSGQLSVPRLYARRRCDEGYTKLWRLSPNQV